MICDYFSILERVPNLNTSPGTIILITTLGEYSNIVRTYSDKYTVQLSEKAYC